MWVAHLGETRLSNRVLHVQHRSIVDFHTDRHTQRTALLLVVPRNTHVRQPPHGLVALADGHEHRLRSNVNKDVHRENELRECRERRRLCRQRLATCELLLPFR